MIRGAALMCACLLVLAACHGGSRAVIVRSVAPVVPVCLDGSRAGAPRAARICPNAAAQARAVSRRVGASRLRPSAQLASKDLRRAASVGGSARDVYIESLIVRFSSKRRDALLETASFVPPADLRGSLD